MRSAPPAISLILCLLCASASGADRPIIVDHTCADLTRVPSQWIDAARDDLHIAYGHTSHGSQITTGMTGLVGFTGGVGGPQFAWNNGGTGGALDLHDNAMPGDVGYYPHWVNHTRAYLDDPANADVNVIIWSWCGQVSGYTQQDMIDKYLAPMTQLELDYPLVMFVYMTGHLDYWSMANTNARNQQIRDYCTANDKILYDFAHIESYDPDGTYFEFANDDCRYWDAGGTLLGNWAVEWQDSHVQGVDWYDCVSAHSEPLNANQKAYAAWWLWARLAGWTGEPRLYCTAKLNSQACSPAIGFSGFPSVADPVSFEVSATEVINNKAGIYFYGLSGVYAVPFQGGWLCAAPPHRRTPVQSSGGNPPPDDCSGSFAFDFNAWMQGGHDVFLTVGVQVNGQYWYRDPASPSTTGLTDAIEFVIGP